MQSSTTTYYSEGTEQSMFYTETDLFYYHDNFTMAIGIQYLPFGELRSNLEHRFNKKQEGEKN